MLQPLATCYSLQTQSWCHTCYSLQPRVTHATAFSHVSQPGGVRLQPAWPGGAAAVVATAATASQAGATARTWTGPAASAGGRSTAARGPRPPPPRGSPSQHAVTQLPAQVR